jgi:hypothetical protein
MHYIVDNGQRCGCDIGRNHTLYEYTTFMVPTSFGGFTF